MDDEREDGPPMSKPHNHQPGWGLVKDCPPCEAWCDDVIARDPTSRPRVWMTALGAQHDAMVFGIGFTKIPQDK
jgi:hypothetical protein